MSLDTRLARLAPTLTAQERAILVLEAWKDGRPEDPSWRRSMASDQSQSFNYYIELMSKTNEALGRLIRLLFQQAEKIELREGWLLSLALWQDHLDDIRQAIRLEVKAPAARKRLDAVLDWTPSVDSKTLSSVSGSLLGSLKEATAYRMIIVWVELQCVDVVLGEVAEAFNGADPLRPVYRDKMDATGQKLRTTREKLLELHGMDVVLRNPLEEELQEMRDWFAELPAD